MGQNNDAMVFIKIKNTGFTLVEILVTIGIMTILFTIVAINLNARKPQVLVENAAREFLSQLTFAKNLALTGAVFKEEDDPPDDQLDVPFGYGVHFFYIFWEEDKNRYFIFGDLYGASPFGNKIYEDGEETNWGDFIVDNKVNVEFTSDGPDIAQYPIGIFFETLNGRIYYYYDAVPLDGAIEIQDGAIEIQVKFSYADDPGINQTVIINKNTNQIYLEE
ncbi:MAG: type II secretion system protein [Candidatus Jacksonbacteria bacterium]